MTQISPSSPYHNARGTIYLLARSAVVSLCGAVFFILVARSLPNVSDLGMYQAIQSLIALSVVLAGADLGRAAVRFISLYIGAGKEIEAERFYTSTFRFAILFSAAVSTVLYLFSGQVSELLFHDKESLVIIQYVAADVFLFTIITYLLSLLYALQDFRKASLVSITNYILKFGTASVLVFSGEGILGVVIGFIVGDSIALLLYFYTLRHKIFGKPSPFSEFQSLLKYSVPLYGSSILVYLSREIDVYLLLILSNLAVVGLYSPAVLIGYILLFILTSLDQSLAPLFSRMYGRSGIESVQGLSLSASRYVFLLYIPSGFAVLSSVPTLLVGLLGPQFSSSIIPAAIIVLALTFTGMMPIFNNILMATGNSRIFFKASLISLGVQIVVSFAAIPILGGIGAATGKAIAYVISFAIPAYELNNKFGLRYDRHSLKIAIIGSLILSLIIFLVDRVLHEIYFLPVAWLIGIVSYLLFLRFTKSITARDLEVFDQLLNGKAKWLPTLLAKIVIE